MSTACSTAARPPVEVETSFRLRGGPGTLTLTVRELDYAQGGLGFRLFPSAVPSPSRPPSALRPPVAPQAALCLADRRPVCGRPVRR